MTKAMSKANVKHKGNRKEETASRLGGSYEVAASREMGKPSGSKQWMLMHSLREQIIKHE